MRSHPHLCTSDVVIVEPQCSALYWLRVDHRISRNRGYRTWNFAVRVLDNNFVPVAMDVRGIVGVVEAVSNTVVVIGVVVNVRDVGDIGNSRVVDVHIVKVITADVIRRNIGLAIAEREPD